MVSPNDNKLICLGVSSTASVLFINFHTHNQPDFTSNFLVTNYGDPRKSIALTNLP